jgi:hypothetical protein
MNEPKVITHYEIWYRYENGDDTPAPLRFGHRNGVMSFDTYEEALRCYGTLKMQYMGDDNFYWLNGQQSSVYIKKVTSIKCEECIEPGYEDYYGQLFNEEEHSAWVNLNPAHEVRYCSNETLSNQPSLLTYNGQRVTHADLLAWRYLNPAGGLASPSMGDNTQDLEELAELDAELATMFPWEVLDEEPLSL